MFNVTLPLRWSDLDAQGHVNNAIVVDYLQEARVAFLRSGPASGLLDEGVVVVGHQVEYRRAIEYSDDGVDVELGVSSLGGSKLELAYLIRQGGEIAARARTTLCAFDFERQAPARLKPQYREFLEEYRVDLEAFRPLEAPHLDGRGTPIDLAVRWTDLDSYGHVNNAKLYDYLQQARITATTQWDPTMARAGSKGSRYLWLVARQDVDYLAQLEHRMEPYAVHVAPSALGSSSITLVAEMVNPADGRVFARARTILVCADQDGRKTDLPDSIRAALSAHLVEAD